MPRRRDRCRERKEREREREREEKRRATRRYRERSGGGSSFMQLLQPRRRRRYRKLRALTALRLCTDTDNGASSPQDVRPDLPPPAAASRGTLSTAGRLDGDLYDSATPSHRLTVIYAGGTSTNGWTNGRLMSRCIAHAFIASCSHSLQLSPSPVAAAASYASNLHASYTSIAPSFFDNDQAS